MSSSPASNGFHQEPTMVKLPPLSPATAENASAPPPPATSTTVNDPNQHPSQLPDPSSSSPRLSSTWDPDSLTTHCTSCRTPFDPLFHRRHHCRLCGRLFCQNCSNTRSLIPPSALVLKRASSSSGDDQSHFGGRSAAPSFAPRDDGDECLTYVRSPSQSHPNDDHDHRNDDTLLYGRGLERRILLARHPQRTCHPCRVRLAPLQEELCLRNSNAMRYNYIDEGDAVRRLCNSPLAFTLGHEVRKAAYALGNLLPGRKGGGDGGGGAGRLGAFLSADHRDDGGYDSYPPPQADPCYAPHGASCKTLDPTLRDLDGVHIPARLLRRAKGVAIVTAAKGGLGFAGFEFGTGLVVARRRGGNVHNDNSNNTNDNHSNDNHTSTNNHPHATNPIQHEEPSPDAWSAPSAIAIAGFAWGALLGAQVSDHVFLLMTDDALRLFSSDDGRSIHLGADVGVALGPLGRAAEADVGAAAGTVAPIYTYSLSKGLYAGISLDGRIVVSRPRVNEKFYGRAVTAKELLSGEVPSPPAAQPLYDALKRCRVYGGGDGSVANAEADGSYGGWSGGSPQENRTVDGGLMERWSHATGAGLPAVSHPSGRDGDVYNLSGRGEPAFMATNDPRYSS